MAGCTEWRAQVEQSISDAEARLNALDEDELEIQTRAWRARLCLDFWNEELKETRRAGLAQ